jgi:hypothetical protein
VTTNAGRAPSGQALVNGAAQGVSALPSRMELVKFYSELEPQEIERRIADYAAEGIIIGRFPIQRFKDGDNIGLPNWAKHVVIGGFCEQGWAAYDQRQRGKKVASGEWGEALFRLRGGRITSRTHRYYSGVLQDALAIATEARRAETAKTGSVHEGAISSKIEGSDNG